MSRNLTTRSIHVHVGAIHLLHGVPADQRRCPVAKAIATALGIPRHGIDDAGLGVTNDTLTYRGILSPLPRPARDMVLAFDAGEPVEPGSFWLTLVEAA